MKIAVISDIHSNYDALKAVVNEINKHNCDLKICLGDMVGYYDKPNEVIECLKLYDFKCIKGNHDKFILGELEYKIENEKIYGINRHRNLLRKENILFLKESLDFIELEYKNKKYCFCHSLKDNSEVYLKDENDVLSKFDYIKIYDYYFHGHTHRRNYIKVNNSIVINPGSVGQQRDKTWKPSFGIMDLDNNEWKVIKVEYDIKTYVLNLRNNGFDNMLVDIFERNIE
ncbi:metallophosphoesterase family protein [Clostridium nigeriense]|uniref:metallophosphoesterase family protein n=1 Tax=Clostridium nigeriense TaxID=1805470 RepID=UPI00082A54DB|nr:metallophosphoesterase family protein [Clostridium nigeriense]